MVQKKFSFTSLLPVVLFAFFCLGLFFHVQSIWHQQLFGDEVHSLFFFNSFSWQALFTQAIEPVHPNGYYILLKIWHTMTPSVEALRWWQFFIFLLSTGILWKILFKDLKLSRRLSITGITLWTTSAYIWHFGFQLRMYGFGMFLVLLSLLLTFRKKLWLSLLIDILLLTQVYGGIIFVTAKWGSVFLASFWEKQLRTRIVRVLQTVLAAIPVLYIIWNFSQQKNLIDTKFLYWVHIPQIEDWSLALLSLLTGLFLPYFEGYSNISPKWQIVGMVGNGLLISGIFGSIILGYLFRKTLARFWKHSFYAERILILTSTLLFVLYTLIFGVSIIWGTHLFHIRQFFSLAVIFLLFFVWTLSHIANNRLLEIFAFLITGAVLVVNILGIATDSIGNKQTYPHHFTSLPGTPLVASHSDVELIFKQCGAYSFSTAEATCQEKNITLIQEDSTIQIPEDPTTWWMTPRTYAQLEVKNQELCTQVHPDFWKCTLKQKAE